MRVDRLLSIILIILNRGNVTGQELAEHFEVSLRTIYRDVEKICEAGVPIASIGGKGGGYYIMEDYDIKNLFINKNEAQTLIPLMNSLGNLMGKNQGFNDIVHKFEKVYEHTDGNGNLKIDLSHFSMQEELKEYLFLINKAIEESRELVFKYINRNKEYGERVTEPIQITLEHGNWYFTAYCKVRDDYRKFKLVRIRNLRIGDRFTKRDISLDKLDQIFSDSYSKRSVRVKLKFSGDLGEQLPEYFNKNNILPLADGYFCVEDVYPYEEGLIKFILGFGQDCEVLEPDFLREAVKEYINKMLNKYNH